MKRKFKQGWSTIPPTISTKRTITSHTKQLHIKMTMTNDFGNLGPGLGQAQQWGGIKLLNVILAFSLLIILSPMVMEIYVKH